MVLYPLGLDSKSVRRRK
uniref:Uncharacterized protein n=1 Tax=Rhizophora mucronata TaxID=61149 RepID=A0A2P2NSV9_RHIMU